jgi:hypothetical protein
LIGRWPFLLPRKPSHWCESFARWTKNELNAAEFKLKIADLTASVAELKDTLTDAKNELAEKDKEISRLAALQRRVADDTVELYGYRYRKRQDDKGPAAGNPFCDVCYQKQGLLIETTHLHEAGRPLQCPNCKAKYTGLRTYTD